MIPLLFSSASRWMAGVAIGIVAALAGALWVQSARLERAQSREVLAVNQARASERIIEEMRRDADRAARIISEQATERARVDAIKQEAIRDVVRSASTGQCVSAAAVTVVLDRLRRWPDADGSRPQAATAGTDPRLPPSSRAGQAGER